MDYQFVKRDVAKQPIVSIRDRRVPTDIPTLLGEAFPELFGRLRLLGATPAGPPFVIYHEFGPDAIDAEVCVPVSEAVSATGSIQSRVLPAATLAGTIHIGRYEELEAAYAAITGWIRESGFETAGPVQERYLNGPGDDVLPAAYVTQIEIPIVPRDALVPA